MVCAAPLAPVPVSSIECVPAATPAGMVNCPLTAPLAPATSVPRVTGSERRTTVTDAFGCHPDDCTLIAPPGGTDDGETDTLPAFAVVLVVPPSVDVVVAPAKLVVVVPPVAVVVVVALVVVVVAGFAVLVVVAPATVVVVAPGAVLVVVAPPPPP